MAPRPFCRVCAHPEALAINAELTRGASVRYIAGRFEGLSKTRVQQHKTECLAPAVGGRVALERIQRDAVLAPVGQAQQRVAIRDVARTQLDRSLTHEQRIDAVWDRALQDLYDDAGNVRKIIDEDGAVRVDMLRELLAVSKAMIEARGGGSLKWATLAAQLEGELRPAGGTTVIVQNGRVVHPDAVRLLDAVAAALQPFPEAAEAVRAALKALPGGGK